MGITRWVSNQVDQLIGTVPLEDLNSLTVEKKTPVVETHTTATEETNTEETIRTTRRISLSSEEKMFVEHIIFSAPLYTTRNEILDQIVDGISSVSGVSREKSTIKYYIYDSVERKKPENRPYRLVFGLKRYSISFKRQAIQEAIRLGQKETQLKFALPSATLSGWLDKHKLDTMTKETQEQNITTEGEPPSPQTVENILLQNAVATDSSHEPTPILDTEDLSGLLDTLAQLQSDNKNLREKVQLHNKALAEAKKRHQENFEYREKGCQQLLSALTANDANINGALDNLIKIESATSKKLYRTTLDKLDKDNANLRHESGKLKLRQERMHREFNEAVKNIPRIRN